MRTFTALLVRGLAAGLLAGLLAGAFAYAVGEPHIDAAIAIEEAAAADTAHTHDSGETEEEPLVSRDGQRAGLFLATGLYGVVLGGVLALAYTLLRRRLRTSDDGYAALGLAAAGFLAVVLVPFLKYPANPPAVGDPETITRRTVSYLLTIVLGLLAVWAAAATTRRLSRDRTPDWRAVGAGVAAFVIVIVAAYLVLPTISEVPGEFPATLLWQFRLASLGTQAVLWLLLGFGFAWLVDRRRLRPN
jgi:predicted cobalt transporter CbtA